MSRIRLTATQGAPTTSEAGSARALKLVAPDDAPRVGTLVVLPARPLAGDPAATEALAGAAGLEPLDVRLKTSTGRAGVLARGTGRAAMAVTAGHIRALGHAAVVVTDAEVADLPRPRLARGVTPEGALAFLDEKGLVVATPPAGARLWVGIVNLAQAPPDPLPMNPARVAAPDPAAVAEQTVAELSWLAGSERAGLLIDVAWNDGTERVRLRGDRLLFSTLGRHAGPSAAGNIEFVMSRLVAAGHSVTLDLEFEQFQPPRVPAGALGRPGAPAAGVDHPRDEREVAWESYVRFSVALWSLGLYDVVTTSVRWHGATVRVTRSATTTTPELATEPPLLLPQAPRADDAWQRWRDRAAILGPVPWVAGLALATAILLGVAMATDGARPWRELAGLSAGALALTYALTLYERRRRVQNVPTSRIRSAAVGPCELHGHARAGAPLRTPFSRMPCVWYEYRMVRRDATDGSSATIRLGGMALSAGGNGPRERVQVVTGRSNDIPFYIEDETGRIEIDPRGAHVEVGTVQTLNSVPFAGAPLPPGTKVSITERYIPVDHPIWVMGHLRVEGDEQGGRADRLAEHLRALKADAARMAAGDGNGDGVVDASEWERMVHEVRRDWQASRLSADGRTDRVFVGRSGHDGFFYITETSEKTVVRRFAVRALACLAAGIGLAAWALLSLLSAGTTKG
jgi:hypothetical protein